MYRFTKPDFAYLEAKIGINNTEKLKIKLQEFSKNIDLKEIANDVKVFLINQNEIDRVLNFKTFVDAL